MKLIIDIPEDMHKRLKDDVIGYSDGGIIIRSIRNGTPIPDNATNGDVIDMIFPDARYNKVAWWNAPYQKGGTNGND